MMAMFSVVAMLFLFSFLQDVFENNPLHQTELYNIEGTPSRPEESSMQAQS
jgi:hypothetical protein